MSITHHLIGLSLLATSLAAQEAPKPLPPDPAKAAAARQEALDQDEQRLVAEWRAEIDEIRKAAEDPANADKPMRAMRMSPDKSSLLPKYAAAAKEFADTPHAASFLIWLVQNASGENKPLATQSVETLVHHHLSNPAMATFGPVIPRLQFMVDKDRLPAIEAKLAKAERADLQGWFAFSQLHTALKSAPLDSKEYRYAKSTLLAKSEAAEVTALTKQVHSAIQLRESYGIGKTAPDIAGVDLDGIEFKLSDYKGKIIFLDFWGDW